MFHVPLNKEQQVLTAWSQTSSEKFGNSINIFSALNNCCFSPAIFDLTQSPSFVHVFYHQYFLDSTPNITSKDIYSGESYYNFKIRSFCWHVLLEGRKSLLILERKGSTLGRKTWNTHAAQKCAPSYVEIISHLTCEGQTIKVLSLVSLRRVVTFRRLPKYGFMNLF